MPSFYQGSSLVLETSPEFSLNQIEYVFYHSSIKFQVLEHVLINQEIATIPLAQKLMISESSLFRKIKGIESSVGRIRIRDLAGETHGEEAQIRYFYFQLLWYLNSFKSQPLPIDTKFVGLIARGLNLTFTEEAQQRVSLWLKIMKYRLKAPGQSFQRLRGKHGIL